MARLDALSIKMTNGSTAEKLAEEYGKVIENLQHITLASKLKNTDLSGDPTSGTVEAKRFVNVTGQTYGTARGHGYADKIKADPVVVSLNDNTEYLEEVLKFSVCVPDILYCCSLFSLRNNFLKLDIPFF